MIQVPMNVTQGMIAQPMAYPANYPAPQYVTSPTPAPVYSEPDQKQYNAVSITVHKPTVEAGSTENAQQFNPYSYTQAPIYDYPQANAYAAPVLAQYQQIPQPVAALPAYEAAPTALPVESAEPEPIVSDSQAPVPQSVIPAKEAPAEAQPAAQTVAQTAPEQSAPVEPEVQAPAQTV